MSSTAIFVSKLLFITEELETRFIHVSKLDDSKWNVLSYIEDGEYDQENFDNTIDMYEYIIDWVKYHEIIQKTYTSTLTNVLGDFNCDDMFNCEYFMQDNGNVVDEIRGNVLLVILKVVNEM